MGNFKFKLHIKKTGEVVEADLVGRYCMDTHNNRWELDEVDILSSFGRKDRNGNDIYEGDIITVITKNRSEEVFLDAVFRNQVICFSAKDDAYYALELEDVEFFYYGTFFGRRLSYCDGLSFSDESLEIVGNIYQNPELLEIRR